MTPVWPHVFVFGGISQENNNQAVNDLLLLKISEFQSLWRGEKKFEIDLN